MEKANKPQFSKANPAADAVFQQLRKDVNLLVAILEPQRRKLIIFKALLFPLLYIITYTSLLLWGQHAAYFFIAYFLLGILLVAIFLNTIHDAVHGTIFKQKIFNEIYVYFFDLMGANSFAWKIRHVRFHHNYPNVNGWDTDIEQSKLARIFPTGKALWVHRFQHIYLPLLYPLYLFNWLLVRDFRDFFNQRRTLRKLVNIPRSEYVKLLIFKSIFLFYLLVIPHWILAVGWMKIFAGFLLLLFTASIFSLMVLLSPHANADSEFPLPDEENTLPHNWMMHMLTTTNDITHDNWFTRFFMGSFNFHVVHHLFPNVNHLYYPEITDILQQYVRKYELPYRQYTLVASLRNHFRLLKKNGVTENVFEETM